MSNLVPIQSIYCSNEDETKLCSFDIEVLFSTCYASDSSYVPFMAH